MRDDKSAKTTKPRALWAVLVAVLAIFAGGVVWSGCGSDDSTSDSTNQAKEEVEEGVKQAEKGIEEGKAQAEKGVEEAKQQAEKYLP